MTLKQYIHRKKPGGYQKITPGKWLTIGAAPTAATASGLMIHKLYARIEWDMASPPIVGMTGFRVRYRLVRKKTSTKAADPTAYDERTVIFDKENFAQHSIEYTGSVRKGEVNRQHYWQMMVVPSSVGTGMSTSLLKNLRVTTRYSDFWRLT